MIHKPCTFVVLLFLGLSTPSVCQPIEGSFIINYGSFNMSELKSFQDEVRTQTPVPVKEISSFPSYPGFAGKIFAHVGNTRFGLVGGVNSSGSRLSLQDYSGSFEYNQTAKLVQLGAGLDYYLKSEGKWIPSISIQLTRGWTNVLIDEKIVVNQTVFSSNQIKFKASNVIFQPGAGIRRNLSEALFVAMDIGYALDIPGLLEDNSSASLKLFNKKNEPIAPDWSGYRASLTFGLVFK